MSDYLTFHAQTTDADALARYARRYHERVGTDALVVAPGAQYTVLRYPLPEAQGIEAQAGISGLPLFEEVRG